MKKCKFNRLLIVSGLVGGLLPSGVFGQAVNTDWLGPTQTWTDSTNWSNGVPDSDDSIFFKTGATQISLGAPRTVANFSIERTSSLIPSFGGFLLTVTNDLTTKAGAAATTFRGSGNVLVQGSLVVEARLDFGSTGQSGANASFGNVTAARTSLTNAMNFTNPGTVDLGALTMSGGTLNTTAGSAGNGTITNNENLISVASVAGSTGTIQAAKAATSGHLRIYGTGTVNNSTYSGVIQNGSGTMRVSKVGSSTLTLAGTNTYTGATDISAGTLLVAAGGAINNTSGVNVSGTGSALRYDNNATALSRNVTLQTGGALAYNSSSNYSGVLTWTNGKLGGSNWQGNLNNLTVNAGRTIAPGNSVGLAATGNQTWGADGAYQWELGNATGTAGATGWDLLTLTGDLTLGSTVGNPFVLSLTTLNALGEPGNAINFNSASNYAWLIADAANAISGFSANLFTLNVGNFQNPYTGVFSVARGDTVGGGDASQIYIVYSVPEPMAMELLIVAGMGLLFFRKRSRRFQPSR